MSNTATGCEQKVPFSASSEWDLIRFIALQLSSRDPRVSVKELIDNAFDAFSSTRAMKYRTQETKQVRVTIRKKQRSNPHIKVFDNGPGWEPHKDAADPRQGMPDFEYTVEHIGDSIKKKFAEFQKATAEGRSTGQFGLGLFSFWALGERLTIYSRSALENGGIGPCSMMIWLKEVKDATIKHGVDPPPELSKKAGSLLIIENLQKTQMNLITGNMLSNYVGRACRPVLMKTGIELLIDDHGSIFPVEPTKFKGNKFPSMKCDTDGGFGSISMEIFALPRVDSPDEFQVPIFCKGARVYNDITEIPELNIYPWNAKKVYGEINYPYGNISPSRTAFVPDDFLGAFIKTMQEITKQLSVFVDKLEALKNARQRTRFNQIFREKWQEIFRNLPEEWRRVGTGPIPPPPPPPPVEIGSMYRVEISPEGAKVAFRTAEAFTARPYDINGNIVRDPSLIYYWKFAGKPLGRLTDEMKRTCHVQAGSQAGITTLSVIVLQYVKDGEEEKTIKKTTAANFWVVEKLPPKPPPTPPTGDRLPNFEEENLGEDGPHSKYNPDLKLVSINTHNRDYLKARERNEETYYRYTNYCFAKEIAVDRWKNLDPHELSERIIELVSVSERTFDWKELTKKPQGRPPKRKESAEITSF
jgi:hypothetical protein